MDRRAVIARHDPADLVTEVTERARCWSRDSGPGCSRASPSFPDACRATRARGLVAAANRALRGRCASESEAFEDQADPAFALAPVAEILWRGAPWRACRRETALEPQVEPLPTDLLDAALKERVRRRLAAWLEADVARTLAPLLRAAREGAGRARARGLAFALAEGLGR